MTTDIDVTAEPQQLALTKAEPHFTEYLCGCRYESAYDAYHDRHCAKCHRESWTRKEK